MAVQFISAESFFFLRKFFGPENPRMGVSIAYFVFLNQSEQKHGGQVYRPREKNGVVNFTQSDIRNRGINIYAEISYSVSPFSN